MEVASQALHIHTCMRYGSRGIGKGRCMNLGTTRVSALPGLRTHVNLGQARESQDNGAALSALLYVLGWRFDDLCCGRG